MGLCSHFAWKKTSQANAALEALLWLLMEGHEDA